MVTKYIQLIQNSQTTYDKIRIIDELYYNINEYISLNPAEYLIQNCKSFLRLFETIYNKIQMLHTEVRNSYINTLEHKKAMYSLFQTLKETYLMLHPIIDPSKQFQVDFDVVIKCTVPHEYILVKIQDLKNPNKYKFVDYTKSNCVSLDEEENEDC
jgi:hypothetical protein